MEGEAPEKTIPNWFGSTLFLVTLAIGMLETLAVWGTDGQVLQDYVEGKWLRAIGINPVTVVLAATPAVGILLSIAFSVGWFASGRRFRRSSGVGWSVALGMAIGGWLIVIVLALLSFFVSMLQGADWGPVR